MNKPAIPATPTALIAEDEPLLAAALQAELARMAGLFIFVHFHKEK